MMRINQFLTAGVATAALMVATSGAVAQVAIDQSSTNNSAVSNLATSAVTTGAGNLGLGASASISASGAVSSTSATAINQAFNTPTIGVVTQSATNAAAGAIGLETMLVAGLRLVHSGELQLMALLRALSTRPAQLLGLPGGTLRAGAPADLIVVDTDVPWVVDPNELKSKCKNTPYDEARMQGRVVRTIVAGRTVYEIV